MSLHSSSRVNGEGSTPKDPFYQKLDELRSLKLWQEKQERKEKGKGKTKQNPEITKCYNQKCPESEKS